MSRGGRDRGRVAGLLVRPASGADPLLREELVLVQGAGPEGDHGTRPVHGVSLITQEDWSEAAAACGAPDLPWQARRANVLLQGVDLDRSRGRSLRLGECLLQVESYCCSCGIMDRAHPGLCHALEQGARAGVCARVVRGGAVRLGDEACFEPDPVEC